MSQFNFHSELFDVRMTVIDGLSNHGITRLSDYGAVDIRHDDYGLEITAIHHESVANEIERHLRSMLPNWRHVKTYYEDLNKLEVGWKVVVTRNKERYDDPILNGLNNHGIIDAIRSSIVKNFPTIVAWFNRHKTRQCDKNGYQNVGCADWKWFEDKRE